MSMFTVTGLLLNIFKTPEGKNAEGEAFGGDHKIQLMGEVFLPNGETKNELIDLKVVSVDEYKPFMNARITVPVASIALARSKLVHYIPKGSKPREAP